MTEDVTIRIPLGSGVAGRCAGEHVTDGTCHSADVCHPSRCYCNRDLFATPSTNACVFSELGHTLNIPNAYDCKYFNRTGDKKTGGVGFGAVDVLLCVMMMMMLVVVVVVVVVVMMMMMMMVTMMLTATFCISQVS